jgi:hypothetical protein
MNSIDVMFSRPGVLALLSALASAPAVASTVSLQGPSDVLPGATFQLHVAASGMVDLYAYQFNLQFDPALFKATGVMQQGFLATAGTTFFDGGAIDNTAGTIAFVLESLIGPGAGASGDGTLLQVAFEAIGERATAGAFALTDFVAFNSSLASVDVTLRGATVAIPEPSALALALLAFGAAGLSARQRPGRQAAGAMNRT